MPKASQKLAIFSAPVIPMSWVGMDHAAPAENKGRLCFQPAHMFADQERRIEPLAQPPVPFQGAASVAIRVLAPEEVCLVARVLTITLPKTERARSKAKRISINGKS